MITINQFIDPVSELFAPDDTKIGDLISSFQVNDICIQIKKEKIEGYYILFEDVKIPISKDGRIIYSPKGFYDIQRNQMREIMGF